MNARRDINGIRDIIDFVENCSRELPVPSGSVLRVPRYAFQNWGIVETPENLTWLYDESRKAYTIEWSDTGKNLNALVGKAAVEAGLGDFNTVLNSEIGSIGAEFIEKSDKRRIKVLDVGGGAGATSLAFLEAVKKIVGNGGRKASIEIDFVEPGASRIKSARLALGEVCGELKNKGINVMINYYPQTEIDFLTLNPERIYDLIISVAAIHHNSFNYHLAHLSKALKNDGLFINGDWNVSMWEHPARVHDLMRDLGASARTLSEFRLFFFIDERTREILDASMTKEERTANDHITRFWISVGNNFRDAGVKSPIWFLEGHEPTRRRYQHLGTAGFETDPDKIKAAFPRMLSLHENPRALIPGSDISKVMVLGSRFAAKARG